MIATIYHDPHCGTSHMTVARMRNGGVRHG